MTVLRDPIQEAFGLTDKQAQDLTIPTLGDYGDLFRCEDFQGNPRRYNFTYSEYYYLRTLQRDTLSIPCGEKGRQLFMTKQFSKPLAAMKNIVDKIIAG